MATTPLALINWPRIAFIVSLVLIWGFWGLDLLHYDNIESITLPKISNWGSQLAKHRPLVLYTYAESENARQNLDYFVKKGLHDGADFIFIFNGGTNATDLLPAKPNVQIVRRENECFDIGAMGQILRRDDLWKKYKRFITMNASVRGPFLPVYNSACWTDLFLDRITPTVKLVGTTMNCDPRPHVQSMLLATDNVGMAILLDPELATSVAQDTPPYGTEKDPVGFTPCFETLKKAVHSEIGITELIRSQGYEVDVLLTAVHASTPAAFCEANGNPPDFLYNHTYFGANVHPYETIFMKANRGIDPVLMDDMTRWHLNQSRSSWDTCGR